MVGWIRRTPASKLCRTAWAESPCEVLDLEWGEVVCWHRESSLSLGVYLGDRKAQGTLPEGWTPDKGFYSLLHLGCIGSWCDLAMRRRTPPGNKTQTNSRSTAAFPRQLLGNKHQATSSSSAGKGQILPHPFDVQQSWPQGRDGSALGRPLPLGPNQGNPLLVFKGSAQDRGPAPSIPSG